MLNHSVALRDRVICVSLRNSFTTEVINEHDNFDSWEMVTLSIDDHFLSVYLFYGAILLLKTWIMSFLTARHRIANKVRKLVICYHNIMAKTFKLAGIGD